MIFIRNLAIAFSLLSLAACSKNNLPADPCACTDPTSCSVSSGDAVCDFIKRAGDRVFFAFDKNELTAESKDVLVKQACWLKANPCVKVTVEGHCDERGTREYNMGLGHRRAQVVKDFLVEQGIEADRITVISYGKDRPIQLENPASSEEIHKANRVSITVIE